MAAIHLTFIPSLPNLVFNDFLLVRVDNEASYNERNFLEISVRSGSASGIWNWKIGENGANQRLTSRLYSQPETI